MNKEMNNKAVSRETLVKASEECKAAFRQVAESVEAAEKAILERAVAGCGEVEVRVLSCEGFEIAIPDEKQPRWYHTDLHYRKDGWRKEAPRRLTMNVAGYGSFGTGDASMVRLMTVVGRLAERLSDIEAEFAWIDWATFDGLRDACWKAHDAVELFDSEAKTRAYNAKLDEARKQIVAGAVIDTCPDYSGPSKMRISINKVTAKMVFWEAVYDDGTIGFTTHHDKISDVEEKIASGSWQVVAA